MKKKIIRSFSICRMILLMVIFWSQAIFSKNKLDENTIIFLKKGQIIYDENQSPQRIELATSVAASLENEYYDPQYFFFDKNKKKWSIPASEIYTLPSNHIESLQETSPLPPEDVILTYDQQIAFYIYPSLKIYSGLSSNVEKSNGPHFNRATGMGIELEFRSITPSFVDYGLQMRFTGQSVDEDGAKSSFDSLGIGAHLNFPLYRFSGSESKISANLNFTQSLFESYEYKNRSQKTHSQSYGLKLFLELDRTPYPITLGIEAELKKITPRGEQFFYQNSSLKAYEDRAISFIFGTRFKSVW